ncbi:MAG: ribonuclease J [bacterium]
MNKLTYETPVDHLRIIPLGGLGEVGRNMMVLEYKNDVIIIDMGLRMPGEDMPGIDYIIPNISYLKSKHVLGVVFTHGHYDHIGAIPYIIDKIGVRTPFFASGLTQGIIIKRQEDFKHLPKLNITTVKDGSKIKLGVFDIEFFHQNHNIADNLGLFIKTPVGNIVHTSDFKFDNNPVNDYPTNFAKLERIGAQNISLLLSDSTGAEIEGHSLSEELIMKNLEEIFQKTKGRIIAATFGSLINRIQQIITLSEKYGRRVTVNGYSMKSNVEICKNLGYIKTQKETLISAKEVANYPDNKVTILCTGAQGEEEAVLMRIINHDHPNLYLKKGDTMIFSSSVIPGNERSVQALKDDILRQGAKVFHYKMMDIHAGGHSQQEELKEMIKIMKPSFFIPIHGQYSMLVSHAELAKEMGIPEKNIIIAENGDVIQMNREKIAVSKERAVSGNVMVDGLGVGDVGEIVIKDRQTLAKDGMFVIIAIVDRQTGKIKNSPDIISRGFVYLRESKDLLQQTRKKVTEIIAKTVESEKTVNWNHVKEDIRHKIGKFLFVKTQRKPIILPVIIEI